MSEIVVSISKNSNKKSNLKKGFMGLLTFIFLVFIGYVTIIALAYFKQAGLIYHPDTPNRKLMSSPESIGLEYESVYMHTTDNLRIHGWYIPAQNQKAVLLFFHGNAGNISHRLESIKIFNQLGLAVLIIDYRGFGLSEGKPSEQGTYLDADAAWRYLTEEKSIDNNQIIIFGRSLGGSIAAKLASQVSFRSLIIESTFVSAEHVAKKLYPYLPVKWLLRFSYDTASYLGFVKRPILIIHSVDDELIAFENASSLFVAANEPKKLLKIRGGHSDGFIDSGQSYIDGLHEFMTDDLKL